MSLLPRSERIEPFRRSDSILDTVMVRARTDDSCRGRKGGAEPLGRILAERLASLVDAP